MISYDGFCCAIHAHHFFCSGKIVPLVSKKIYHVYYPTMDITYFTKKLLKSYQKIKMSII